MPFPFVARWIYEAEHARCDRLMDELIRLRAQGFTTPAPVPTVEQPVEPEQRALADAERPVLQPVIDMLMAEQPNLSRAVAEREARRMMAELNGQ